MTHFEKNSFAVRRPMAYDDSWLPRLSAFVDDSLPPIRFVTGLPPREPVKFEASDHVWEVPHQAEFNRLIDKVNRATIDKRERELVVLVDNGELELYYGPIVPLCLRPIPARGVE